MKRFVPVGPVSRDETTSNVKRWVHQHFGSDESITSVVEREDHVAENIRKQLCAIFKRASPKTVMSSIIKMKGLDIYSVKKMNAVIDFVLERAVENAPSAALFATISMYMGKVEVSDGKSKMVLFEVLLAERCRAEFERGPLGSEERTTKTTEIDRCRDPAVKRTLEATPKGHDENEKEKYAGLMRFIGELHGHDLLADKCLTKKFQTLLDRKNAESLEYLCVLLGAVRDSFKGDLAPVIDKMHKFAATSTEVSARVRSMIDDLK